MRTLGPRLLNGISTLADLEQGASEYLFHQCAIIRRQAQVLEGTTTKVGFFFKVVFGGITAVMVASAIVFLLTFLHQHYHDWVQPWMGVQIEQMTEFLPPIGHSQWILILLLDAYFCKISAGLRNKFAEREYRVKEA